jgi:hypothetical protein
MLVRPLVWGGQKVYCVLRFNAESLIGAVFLCSLLMQILSSFQTVNSAQCLGPYLLPPVQKHYSDIRM